MAWSPGTVLEWLLGEEGSVATEADVQVVMAATGTALTGLYLVSPIVSVLSGPFAVSAAAAGQLITAFTAPSILFVPVFGVLADRYGPRVVLVFGLLAFGLGGGLIALAPSFEVAIGLRLVQGIGYAAINPVGVAILGDAYAGSREATAQGLRVVSIQVAGLVVPPAAGALVIVGWQYPFLLYFLALPIAGLAWYALPTTERTAGTSMRSYVSDLRSSLATAAVAAVVVSFLARYALSFSLVAYISVLLGVRGASSVDAGVVLALLALVSILASTQAGRVTARIDPALAVMVAFAGIAAGFAVMGAGGTYSVVLIGVVIYGVAAGVSSPVQKSLVTQLAPPAVRAGTVSSAVTFQSLGAAGGPFLMGITLQHLAVGTTYVVFGLVFGLVGGLLTLVAYLADGRGESTAASA